MNECCDIEKPCELPLVAGPKGKRGDAGERGPTGDAGSGIPAGTEITHVGNYLEWDFAGQAFHHRLLSGPAPVS